MFGDKSKNILDAYVLLFLGDNGFRIDQIPSKDLSPSGYGPLHCAVILHDGSKVSLLLIERLIELGYDPLQKGSDGEVTTLDVTAGLGHIDVYKIIKRYLPKSALDDKTIYHLVEISSNLEHSNPKCKEYKDFILNTEDISMKYCATEMKRLYKEMLKSPEKYDVKQIFLDELSKPSPLGISTVYRKETILSTLLEHGDTELLHTILQHPVFHTHTTTSEVDITGDSAS